MAVANGFGKVVTSGSVFMYDTGDTLNSYRGEPTTNLLTYSTNFSAGPWYGYCGNSSNITPNTTEVVDPFGGFNATKVVRNNQTICDGSTPGWGLIYSSGGTLSANNTYTTSIYARCATGTMSFRFGISDYYATTITLTTEWQRFTLTSYYEAPAQNDRVFQFFSTDQNVTYYVCAAQTELKSHATQYAASGASQGTRSVTQGLLPIVGNSTINLSNVSFDSNAQLDFDGTDDRILLTNFTTKPTTAITCETIIKPTRPSVGTGTIRGGAISSTNSMYLGIIDSVDGGNTFAMHWANQTNSSRVYNWNGQIPNNAFSHLVGTYDGQTARAYLNGVEIWSTSQTGTIPDADYYIGTYGGAPVDGVHNFNGYIPIAKVYNRALSSSEVTQNYNKYKTRFNLP